MSVLCCNCGASLQWNYSLEAKANENGHSVYCKKCAKLYRRNTPADIKKLKELQGM